MKKLGLILTAAILAASLLAGCGQSTSSSSPASEPAVSSEASSSSAAASSDAAVAPAGEEADTAKLDSIVASIEAVNEVPNARAIDDFSLENEMALTKDNIVAFKGDVTNDQADCALVFAAQVKEGTADAVKTELEAYQSTMTSSLYAEFADKVAKAQDARIVVKGNYVVMVISGINGPDYAAIDTAIDSALA